MSWLSGLDTISGPRWSCAAYWAEDGNAQASDTDWGDSTTWDAAHAYDDGAAVSLGVFLAGDDVTQYVRAAEWGAGQSEPLPSAIQPSSASVTLKGDRTVAANDRLCILTEWDVLYVGRVENVTDVVTVERTDTALTATDELARVALVAWPEGDVMGGSIDGMLTRLMALGGVVLPWYGTPVQPALVINGLEVGVTPDAERSGSVLDLIGAVLYAAVSQGAWTPQGLRISGLDLVYLDEDDRDWPDVDVYDFDDFDSYSVERAYGRVYNQLTVDDGSTTYTEAWTDSQDTYGKRAISVDVEDWTSTSWADSVWSDIIAGDYGTSEASHVVPLPTFTGNARIISKRHALARLLPFDYISDGNPTLEGTTERYKLLRTQHSLSPDSWDVTLQGVLVRKNDYSPAETTYDVKFNNSIDVTFNGLDVTFTD